MSRSEIMEIIRQLKKGEIGIFDIPEGYENNIQLVTFERKAGLRITGKRGFDVITNSFFVEETLECVKMGGEKKSRNVFMSFEDFDSYYDFLHGDIYDNACYTFCDIKARITTSHEIDISKMMERNAFVEDTVDSYSLSASDDEIAAYQEARHAYKMCQLWVKKFNDCNSVEQLSKTASNYQKSKVAQIVDIDFFYYTYVFSNIDSKERSKIFLEYLFSKTYPEDTMVNALCSIYDPSDVVQALDHYPMMRSTVRKHKARLRLYICSLKNKEIEFYSKAYFDRRMNYYCEETRGYRKDCKYFPVAVIRRYFESFKMFADYRGNDFTCCDLSGALECNADFSNCIMDDTTKLPPQLDTSSAYTIQKGYSNQKFYVRQAWSNSFGITQKEYKHSFKYFFDFVAFLKGNLSGANLLFCDGLIFLRQWSTIDFENARMKSSLCEKFGIKYNLKKINGELVKSFGCVEKNEKETALVLGAVRNLGAEAARKDLSSFDLSYDCACQRVHYISDIHLMHRIKNAGCRSKEDIIYVIQKIVNTIAAEAGSILLIGGDVASDFEIFQLFVKILSRALHGNTQVIFTLGNHELWSFPGCTIDQIVSKYRTLLNKYGMYLLQNDLFYKEDGSGHPEIHLIRYSDLCTMDKRQIADCLRYAKCVILGGIGFSGYNARFNADNGIYRMTLDRTAEIKETQTFELLYNRLCPILEKKNTVILTHTPKIDWCADESPDKNFVYVSGHTHRNFFHDDGEYRVYSDNQIGYGCETPHLKNFLIDNDYDCFSDYDDGIFEITKEQYNGFYRGKNIAMTFQREVNKLYMLKKKEYYCFIHKSQTGTLTILNGGAMKKLRIQEVQYYYDRMDSMIATIKSPLDKFTSYQKQIADLVKKIGGRGTIHGSIIDIDFWNHIYVNPFDLSTSGYWASNMINKVVYPSIPSLLEQKCPALYGKYVKLIGNNSKYPLVLERQTEMSALPQLYLDTDIYKASREIKKMQKLNSNILTTWYEGSLNS